MIRSLKPNPKTGVQEWWRIWDQFSHYPESIHMFTWLLDDVGVPKNQRQMDGWGVHTFTWVNAAGKNTLVRYQYESLNGNESFETDSEAALNHFSFATTDLQQNIEQGNYPKWKVHVQMVDPDDQTFIDSLPFDLLDTTKEWPLSLIKPIEIGIMEFNRNVNSQ